MRYKIFADSTLISDSRMSELRVIDPVIKKSISESDSFEFELDPESEFYNLIQTRKTIIKVLRDDVVLFKGYAVRETETLTKTKKIICESALCYLNDSIQRTTQYTERNTYDFLADVIANHNEQVETFKRFELGEVLIDENVNVITDNGSTKELIENALINQFGGYLLLTENDGVNVLNYVDDSYGDTSTQEIRLGENLLSYESNLDSMDVVTRVIPLGAVMSAEGDVKHRLNITSVNDGLDYLESNVNRFTTISRAIVFEDVVDASELKEKGQAYLTSSQFDSVQIRVKALDMSLIDSSIESFKLFNLVRVVSKPHGMDRYFPITEMTIHLNEPQFDEYVLGANYKTSMILATNSKIALENKKTESRIEVLDDSITLEVARAQDEESDIRAALNMKLGWNDDGKIVSMLSGSADRIHFNADNCFTVDSPNFSVSDDGQVTAKDFIAKESLQMNTFARANPVPVISFEGEYYDELVTVFRGIQGQEIFSSGTEVGTRFNGKSYNSVYSDFAYAIAEDCVVELDNLPSSLLNNVNFTQGSGTEYHTAVTYMSQIGRSVYALANPIATSDKRLKTDIKPLDDSTDFYMKLKPSQFRYKDELIGYKKGLQFGLIAQDVQDASNDSGYDASPIVAESPILENDIFNEKEVVNDDKVLLVHQDQLHAMHIQQIQKLNVKVNELEQEIKTLKALVNSLLKGKEK